MSIFSQKKVEGITRRVLNMILESSKDAYPNEFACGLREIDGIISELILVPGTISGPTSAILKLHSLPIDYSIVGIAHSHPTPSNKPSPEDLMLFSRYGRVHIIVGYPYDLNSWQTYDWNGNNLDLKLID